MQFISPEPILSVAAGGLGSVLGIEHFGDVLRNLTENDEKADLRPKLPKTSYTKHTICIACACTSVCIQAHVLCMCAYIYIYMCVCVCVYRLIHR